MRALVSVYDKKGVKEFCEYLSLKKWEIYSTGGTRKFLEKAGIDVTDISEVTGYPDMLEGRVKTLHPAVFGGLLARRDQKKELARLNIKPFGLICVNLYPFTRAEKEGRSEKELLEYIDIGGVSLIRAGAKNYKEVRVVCDPRDYTLIMEDMEKGTLSLKKRRLLAAKAFSHTCEYEQAISSYFNREQFILNLPLSEKLRYGENPHQRAALYGTPPFTKIQGKKELSFNNYQDLDAGVGIVKSFTAPACAIIKHSVPCGAAVGSGITEAYEKAYSADPMSAFGGIVTFNRELNEETAREMSGNFYEVVAAPSFSRGALRVLEEKENLRVVEYDEFKVHKDWRKISGGVLVQDPDSFKGEKWKIVTSFKPDERQEKDLRFAWKIAAFLKSNAVAIVGGGKTMGLGGGETARVSAVEIAVNKMKKFCPREKVSPVMASDAFFPFPDAVERAAAAGIKSIIQPGGSKNDSEVVDAAEKLGVSMVFTGRRHFLH